MKFLQKLAKIVGKNLKLILRSKGSALIVIFGPLFMILLVGTAFNTTSVYGIRVGVFSEGYTDLSEAILNELAGKQFNIIRMQSRDECIENLKVGEVHVCSIFPPNLNIKTESNILFYVDPSRINLVYLLIEGISSKVETKAEEISLQLTKQVLEVLTSTKNEIGENRDLAGSIITASHKGDQNIEEASLALSGQDFNIKESDFDFDSLEDNANNLAKLYNISVAGILGPLGRIKLVLREKIGVIDKNAELGKSAVRLLKETKKDLEEQDEAASFIDKSFSKIEVNINKIGLTSAAKIVSPISTKIEPVVAKKTHLNYLFPTLIMMIVMFMAVLLSSIIVIREKTSISYFRNFISPTGDALFMLGVYITSLIIVVFQLLIVFGVAFYFFRTALLEFIPNVLAVLLIFVSMFTLLGMIIGYMFRSEETSSLAAISAASIMLFFSNTVLPLETLPTLIVKIARYNPFVIGESMLRKIMIFQYGLGSLAQQIYIALGVLAVLFIVALISNSVNKKAVRA